MEAHLFLIFISFVANVERFFVCLLALCAASFKNSLFGQFI
jgi:hypothetical protein